MANLEELIIGYVIYVPVICLLFGLLYLCIPKSTNVVVQEEVKSEEEPPKKKGKKSGKKGPKIAQETKDKPKTKPKNINKIVPKGKAAYCSYCEVYMADDEQLMNHEKGKKHTKNCKKEGKWYTITDPITEDEKFKPFTEEDVEEGWTL